MSLSRGHSLWCAYLSEDEAGTRLQVLFERFLAHVQAGGREQVPLAVQEGIHYMCFD
jgi:hypothetical protein